MSDPTENFGIKEGDFAFSLLCVWVGESVIEVCMCVGVGMRQNKCLNVVLIFLQSFTFLTFVFFYNS